MTTRSHDDIELRIAEALTGDAPLDASLKEHLQDCASCATLGRALRALATEASQAEPSPAAWADFDRRLKARIATEPREAASLPSTRRLRPWRGLLPLAAAVGFIALALWVVRGRRADEPPVAIEVAGATAPLAGLPGPDESPVALPEPDWTTGPLPEEAIAVPSSPDPVATLVAAASAESLDAGLQALGLTTDWEDEAPKTLTPFGTSEDAEILAPAPAWDDVLGGLEEEFATLDPAAQESLARALRVAS